MRIVVVGGGVLGTMHAWHAAHRGHQVVQIEREAEARGASVRNFGLVWVGGRAAGAELDTAVRARELWAGIGAAVPGIGFRPNGSLTVLRTKSEYAVAEDMAGRADAEQRGFTLLDPEQTRAVNPLLSGDFLGALHCDSDAAVEPRLALPALRAALLATGRYTWLPGREVRDIDTGVVRDDRGARHDADLVVLCTGAWLGGAVRELAGDVPVRNVRLQMMQTEPMADRLTTSVADADSFRYYPAYQGTALDALNSGQPQSSVAAEHAMQLLMVQRLDGSLTIGDTHGYTEPFPFDVTEAPYRHLVEVAEALLGRPLPPIRQRWAGVYAQCRDTTQVVHREQPTAGVWLVTGPGGRGMTCSPAIAEQTMTEVGL
jgi:FAD dependent oxidoreductase TIGR03364